MLLEADSPVLVVVVEVQLSPDDDKLWSWPCYVTLIRRGYRCPCILLVLAPDDEVANWCSRPIPLGPDGSALRPIVLRRDVVPRILEPEAAAADVELAVLSAVAHGDHDPPEQGLEIALAAMHALAMPSATLDEDRRRVYLDLVLSSLSGAARTALEALMNKGGYQYQSDFARKYFSQGREEGREEGRVEGRALALLEVLKARGSVLDEAQVDRVCTCRERALLDRWLHRAVSAATLADVFADG